MAEPIPFKQANANLVGGEAHPDVCDLPVCRAESDVGPLVISCWRLTKPEIAEIERTGLLWVTVVGHTTPPIAIHVSSPFLQPPPIVEDNSGEGG